MALNDFWSKDGYHYRVRERKKKLVGDSLTTKAFEHD